MAHLVLNNNHSLFSKLTNLHIVDVAMCFNVLWMSGLIGDFNALFNSIFYTGMTYLNLDLLKAFTTAASNPLLPSPTLLYFFAILRTVPAKPY